MKRGIGLLALFALTILVIPLVSAQTALEDLLINTSNAISPFLESIFLTPDNLSKALLGILLWIVLYSVVKGMGLLSDDKMGSIGSGVVALIITTLSFLYMPQGFVEATALQYGAVGATILAVIPFMIMLYFTIVATKSTIIARATWIFYTLYYFGLFIFKLATLQAEEASFVEYIPYSLAILAGIIIFFFIKDLRELYFKGKLENQEEKAIRDINIRGLNRKVEIEEAKTRGLGG